MCLKSPVSILYDFVSQLVIRAHQATAAGVDMTESSRVCTVFSTSKDHGCGSNATCGCLMIENGIVFPIARSICYDMSAVPSAHECDAGTSAARASHGQSPREVAHSPRGKCHS